MDWYAMHVSDVLLKRLNVRFPFDSTREQFTFEETCKDLPPEHCPFQTFPVMLFGQIRHLDSMQPIVTSGHAVLVMLRF